MQNHAEIVCRDSRPGFVLCKLVDDLPFYTSTPIVNRQDSLNVQPVFEIAKRLDRMESELRKFKQTIGSSMEHKMQELRTNIVSTLEKMIAENTYASAVQGQNQSNHRAAKGCCNHAEVIHNSEYSVTNNYVATSHRTKDSSTTLPVYKDHHRRL